LQITRTAYVGDGAFQTVAQFKRRWPSRKLDVAGLVQPVGGLLWPGDPAGRADHAADAVRTLLGVGVPPGP
jgi:hypothetical protein